MNTRRGALLFAALCLAATWWRYRYGVALNDEAFHAALPYRFFLGDRPFVDETSPAQFSALLTWPLVWLFVRLAGSTNGIILFLRGLHGLLAALAAYAVFRAVRPREGFERALLAALPVALLIPWSMPSLSYNTLGSLLGVIGFYAALLAARGGGWGACALSGAALAGSAVAFPPYLASSALFAALLFPALAARKRAVLACAFAAVFLIFVGPHLSDFLRGREALALAASYPKGRGNPLIDLLRVLLIWPAWWAAIVLCGGAWHLAKKRNKIGASACLAAAMAVTLTLDREAPFSSLLCAARWGLLAPLLWLAAGGRWNEGVEEGAIWPAAAFGAALAAWASTAGPINAGFPLLAAVPLSGLAAAKVLDRAGVSKRAALLPLVAVALAFVYDQGATYSEAPLAQLTAPVPSGPFAGLRTTPERARFLGVIQEAVSREPAHSVAFYFNFPAGYLMTTMRPAVSSVWTSQAAADAARRDAAGLVVGVFDGVPYLGRDAAGLTRKSIEAWTARGYRARREGADFVLLGP